MHIPTFTNAAVEDFLDLPSGDDIGSRRLVRNEGKEYVKASDSLDPTLMWREWTEGGFAQPDSPVTLPFQDVQDFGAIGDARIVRFVTLINGSTTATVSQGGLTAQDKGKTIAVPNGSTGDQPMFSAQIVEILSGTQCVISVSPTATTSNQEAVIGTDCTDAFPAAIAAAGAGGHVFTPSGSYLTRQPVKPLRGQLFEGAGVGATKILRVGSGLSGVRHLSDSFGIVVAGDAPDDDYVTYYNERGDHYASNPRPFALGTLAVRYHSAAASPPLALPPTRVLCVLPADLAALTAWIGKQLHVCEGAWQPMPIRSQFVTVIATQTVTANGATITPGTGRVLSVAALSYPLRKNDALVFSGQGHFVLTSDAAAGATSLTGTLGGTKAPTQAHIVSGDVASVVHLAEPVVIPLNNNRLSYGQATHSPSLSGNPGRKGNHIWQLTPSSGTNAPTGGTYTITFAALNPVGGTTVAISADATNTAIQTAIETVVGAGNVAVTGGPITKAAPLYIELKGTHAATLFLTSPTITSSLTGTSPTLTVSVFKNGQAPTGTSSFDLWDGSSAGYRNINDWPTAYYWRVDPISDVTIRGLSVVKPLGDARPYGIGVFRGVNIRLEDVATHQGVVMINNCQRVFVDGLESDCSTFWRRLTGAYPTWSPNAYLGNGCHDLSLRRIRHNNVCLWVEEGANDVTLDDVRVSNIRDETAAPFKITGGSDKIFLRDVHVEGNDAGALSVSNSYRVSIGGDCTFFANGRAFDGSGPNYLTANFASGAVPIEVFNAQLDLSEGGATYRTADPALTAFRLNVKAFGRLRGPLLEAGSYAVNTGSAFTGSFRRRDGGDIASPTAKLSQSMAAATTIAARSSSNLNLSATGNITLTATPTIDVVNAIDGQKITLTNVSAFSITLQDSGTLAGSALRLGATTRTLATQGSITLEYRSSLSAWAETDFTNLI